MIAVTGPTRNGLGRLLNDPVMRSMGPDDYLIVLGDSGVFEPRTAVGDNARRLKVLPCRILFIEGGTDDYDAIADQPRTPWNGGAVNAVARGVARLCRGSVFDIGGRTILAFGGATTPGRDDLGKYHTWWPEQDPGEAEIQMAIENANKVGGVDYILSCDCPERWKAEVPGAVPGLPSGLAADRLLSSVCYGRWYFSNGYADKDLRTAGAYAVNQRVVPLERRSQSPAVAPSDGGRSGTPSETAARGQVSEKVFTWNPHRFDMADEKGGLTVARITAASMINFCCNAVSRASDTKEGSPSRRAKVGDMDHTFRNLRASADRCRESEPDVCEILMVGVKAYEAYRAKHDAVEALPADDAAKAKAIAEADEEMDRLAAVMNGLVDSFH